MRNIIIAGASACAVLCASATAPAWAQMVDEISTEGMPENPHNLPRFEPRPFLFVEDQLNTVAAGLVAADALKSTSRDEVMELYGKKKAQLRARLSEGMSYAELYPSEDGELGVPDREYSADTTKATKALSAEEAAYFKNAQVWVAHLVLAGGSVLDRPSLDEPTGFALGPDFSHTCVIEYNADQVPALAAGLRTDDILYHSDSRSGALALWNNEQDTLRAWLGENGWGSINAADLPHEDMQIWPIEEHTVSSVIADDLGSSKTGAPSTLETPFSLGEVVYFKSAASYTAQRFEDCSKDIARHAPAAPSSLSLALAPTHIAGIIAALLAVLGAVGAAASGAIPGLALPF